MLMLKIGLGVSITRFSWSFFFFCKLLTFHWRTGQWMTACFHSHSRWIMNLGNFSVALVSGWTKQTGAVESSSVEGWESRGLLYSVPWPLYILLKKWLASPLPLFSCEMNNCWLYSQVRMFPSSVSLAFAWNSTWRSETVSQPFHIHSMHHEDLLQRASCFNWLSWTK